MHIELSGTVRGEPVTVQWCEGELSGSDVLLQRLGPMVDDGRCVTTDVTSVVRCVEQVAGQRMRLRVCAERTPAATSAA